jgi:outer membrane immunogenic protein
MRKLVAVCAAFCALTLPALAADVSVSPLGTYPPPRPVYSWTGCRIGANIGGGSAPTSWSDPFGSIPNDGGPGYLGDHTASGVIGGGQLGCDYQVGRFVFGLQGVYDLTGMKASNIEPLPVKHKLPGVVGVINPATGLSVPQTVNGTALFSLINETFIQSTANLTARIGYTVQPSLLLYAKAGIAWNHNLYNGSTSSQSIGGVGPNPFGGPSVTVFTVPGSFIVALGSDSRFGPLFGTGLEWAVFGTDVSLFLEYDYLHFGTNQVTLLSTLTPGKTFPIDITQNVNMVLFGINYRFYGGP